MARADFVSGAWAGPQTTHAATVTTWAAGDTMLACCLFVSGSATVTGWTMAGESAPSNVGTVRRGVNGTSIQWAILSNVTGTGSKAVTATLSASVTGVTFVYRLTGRDTAGAYDVEAGVVGTGAASASNAITASAGSDVFSVCTEAGFDQPTPSAGTEDTLPDFNNYEDVCYLENQTGSVDITWSWSGSSGYGVSTIAVKAAGATAELEQEGFRWGNDDGSESAHTWAAAQDSNITAPAGETRLLNVIVNATGTNGAKVFKLQYRQVGDPDWTDVPIQ